MITGYSNIISVTTATPSLLLDLYPSAAAAYSVRKLRAAYTGSAIRVRRSSDNTEQDIGFSSGNLDTSALTTFCGSGDGFVTTWYDQSGNGNNVIQSTAISQPQIVSAGVLLTQNSKPILRFVNQFLQFNTGLTPATNWSLFGVGKKNIAGQYMTYIGGSTGLNSAFISFGDDNIYLLGQNGYISSSDSVSTTYRVNSGFVITNTANSIYRNNNLLSPSISTGSPNQDFFYIGRYGTGGANENSSFNEIILYQSNQLSNNSGINTNINTYYAIY